MYLGTFLPRRVTLKGVKRDAVILRDATHMQIKKIPINPILLSNNAVTESNIIIASCSKKRWFLSFSLIIPTV